MDRALDFRVSGPGRSRFIAVTLLEPGSDVEPALTALVVDPRRDFAVERLDLRYPRSGEPVSTGKFVVSATGDIDGDGRDELVYGVTPGGGAPCYLLAYTRTKRGWSASPITDRLPSTRWLRSLAVGDLDGDGRAEIVTGDRPSGAVVVSCRTPDGYVSTMLDRGQYGADSTSTRGVVIGDVDNDGRPEIVVATARLDTLKWQPTPGALLYYAPGAQGTWRRSSIEDHAGSTHSRMVAVADFKGDGVQRSLSCALGILDDDGANVARPSALRLHTIRAGGVESETIDTLEESVKSRSFAFGDVDGDGRDEIVIGTRAPRLHGRAVSHLYVYSLDPVTGSWTRDLLDSTTCERGFHCVQVLDVNGDGRAEVVASDDGLGVIKAYSRHGDQWGCRVLYSIPHEFLCLAIHSLEVEA